MTATHVAPSAADRDALPGPAGAADDRADAGGRGCRTADRWRRPAARGRVRVGLDPGRPGRQSLRGPGGEFRGGHDRARPPRCRRRHAGPGGAAESRLVGVGQRAAGRLRGGARRHRAARSRSRAARSERRRTPTTRPSSWRAPRPAGARSSPSRAATSVVAAGSSGSTARRRSARDGRSRSGCPLPALSRTRIAGRSDRATEPATGRSRSSATRSSDRRPGSATVAAIVVEPVQGNGGVVIPPAGFLAGPARAVRPSRRRPHLRRDPGGFGRTGRVWAAEHWGVVPDLMTVGKGIGGGMAVSAVVGRERFMGHWAAGCPHLDVHGQRRQPGRRPRRDRRLPRRATGGPVGGARRPPSSGSRVGARRRARMSARSAAWACSSASSSSTDGDARSPTRPGARDPPRRVRSRSRARQRRARART